MKDAKSQTPDGVDGGGGGGNDDDDDDDDDGGLEQKSLSTHTPSLNQLLSTQLGEHYRPVTIR